MTRKCRLQKSKSYTMKHLDDFIESLKKVQKSTSKIPPQFKVITKARAVGMSSFFPSQVAMKARQPGFSMSQILWDMDTPYIKQCTDCGYQFQLKHYLAHQFRISDRDYQELCKTCILCGGVLTRKNLDTKLDVAIARMNKVEVF